MTSLAIVIGEILRSREFQVSEEDGYLFGKRRDIEVVFLLTTDGNEAAVRAFQERFKDYKGNKVIATLAPALEIKGIDDTVSIWNREAIEHEIGRVHIERIVVERDQSLVDEFGVDDYPKMVTAEDLEKVADHNLGEKIVRPVMGLEEVKQMAAQTVAGFQHLLELVPHYLFRYRAGLYIDQNRVGEKTGVLAVNALNCRTEPWPENSDIVDSLSTTYRRLEPKIEPEEAKNYARQGIIAMHASEMDIVREENHVTITEKKPVSPRPDSVELEELGIVYLPVWCVEGVKGVMVLNASTGKVISEDYYREIA